MQHLSPLPNPEDDDLRIARRSVLNGLSIPPMTASRLEARGVDVPELERRLIETQRFT